jgi:hypothetical protein
MSFVGGQVAFATLHGYRMVWLPGAFGNGKTLCAVGMYAQYFRPRGYRLVSNLQTVWTESDLKQVNMDENGKLKTFILIDEGGQYFEDADDIKDVMRNPRKMDYILCFASFVPPAKIAQIFQIQPTWSYRSAGIPFIHYEWSAKIGHYKNKGHFGWWFFQEMYGTYSSSSPAGSPASIRRWLVGQNNEYRRRWGYDDEDTALDSQDGAGTKTRGKNASENGEEGRNVVRAIRNLSSDLAYMDEAADEVATLFTRGTKRRK